MDSTDGLIGYDDFSKVKLVVGVVTECILHPNADKLLVLTVDVGEDKPRSICAGIREWYSPMNLEGRRIVVVLNLIPRVMRGVPSEGMLLAATDKHTGAIRIVSVDDHQMAAGSGVK